MPKLADEEHALQLENEVIDFSERGVYYDTGKPHQALTQIAHNELKLKIAGVLRARAARRYQS